MKILQQGRQGGREFSTRTKSTLDPDPGLQHAITFAQRKEDGWSNGNGGWLRFM